MSWIAFNAVIPFAMLSSIRFVKNWYCDHFLRACQCTASISLPSKAKNRYHEYSCCRRDGASMQEDDPYLILDPCGIMRNGGLLPTPSTTAPSSQYFQSVMMSGYSPRLPGPQQSHSKDGWTMTQKLHAIHMSQQ